MNRKLSKSTIIFIVILLVTGPLRTLMEEGVSGLMEDIIDIIYTLPGIAIGLSFHEFGHAWVADRWGDDTPARDGRVTIDPRAHVDLIGLIYLLLIGFGWGKPVRINPQRFRKKHAGLITVGLAGVGMNLIMAFLFGGILKLVITIAPAFFFGSMGQIFYTMCMYIVIINISLMLFNLLPVPPLDGFNVIAEVFRLYPTKFYAFMRQYGDWILILMILFDVPSLILSTPLSAITGFIMSTVYRIW